MQVFWDYELSLPKRELPDAAVYFDNQIMQGPRTSHKFNIAVVTCEPFEIIGHDVEKYLLNNWRDFDLILTDKDALLTLPNSIIFVYGHPWMKVNSNTDSKIYGVSSVVGHKMWTIGHRMRHVLWDRRHEIVNVPTYIYASQHGGAPSDRILYSDKLPLFDFQFHIAIESVKTNYYVTEKLIDCFQTSSVPIYYGAKQIGDLFDERGFFCVDSVDDIIDVCNNLNSKCFKKMLRYVNINRQIAGNYDDFGSRVVAAIFRHLVTKDMSNGVQKATSFGDYAGSECSVLRSQGYTKHSKPNLGSSRIARFRRWIGR